MGTLNHSQEGTLYEKPAAMRTCHIHVDVKHSDHNPPPPPQVPSFYGDYDGTNSLDIVKMTDHPTDGTVEFSGNNYLDSPNAE